MRAFVSLIIQINITTRSIRCGQKFVTHLSNTSQENEVVSSHSIRYDARMSWYRIYRPQTVASLHITPVREAFSLILSSGEFSHAYLLTGPKGTGKTSGARILAKILNCEKNRDVIEARLHPGKDAKKKTSKPASLVEPCNSCSTCIAITNGSSLCVSEMDAARDRKSTRLNSSHQI